MALAAAEHDSSGLHDEVLAFLASGAAFDGARPERIDTHAAHLFLAGDGAWKLKRPVRYDYLDFTSSEKRRAALDAELKLNRRTAPGLYRKVVPVTRSDRGTLALGGDGEPVEWVLEMTRFPDDALLDAHALKGTLDTPLMLRLADRIVALHAAAEPVRGTGDGADRIRRILDGNAVSFRKVSETLDPDRIADLLSAQRAELKLRADQLDARARAGRVRRGHGDLHLRNIALIDGDPILFDCLEFSEELATTDVLYDLAFLLMDLWHRDLRQQANVVVNRYCDVAAQGASGYSLLPLFISIRASIRAHVLAAAAQCNGDEAAVSEANRYLDLASEVLAHAPARLIAIGGPSGTGKSTLARLVAAHPGRAPGARVLRSDVFRKRLAGVAPETRLPPSSYTAAATQETYEALFESAEDHLDCGTSVVLDAMFARRAEREVAEILAHRAKVSFAGLWLEAPEHERVARVRARADDASDAGPEVAREQSRRSVGELGGWHRMRVNRPLDRIVPAARAILDRAKR